MKPPEKIKRLVEVFERNLPAYKSSRYKEANVRTEFIEPFFVSFLGKITDHTVTPEVYIVPSMRLAPLVYHSPGGKRHVLQLARMRKDGAKFRDAWDLLK